MNSNSAQICRLCLETCDGLVNIFEKFQDETIASVLAKHFWFQIYKDDGMPEWVCEICWSQTRTFHHFYKRLELRYRNYMNSIDSAKVDEIWLERSVSPMELELEADLDIVKCEEDITITTFEAQTLSNGDSCDVDNDDNSGDQSEAGQTNDDDDKPSASLDKPSRDAELRKFFKMKCDICSDVKLDTLKKLRKHYRQVHKTDGYLICCGMKFKFRHRMLEHIQYHVNPDAHRCEQCGKRCRGREALKNHEKIHIPLNLRGHKCSFCFKYFTSNGSLNTHVRERHTNSSETFTCDHCGRIYRSKMKIETHMKNVHSSSRHEVCEICGRTFKYKDSLHNHKEIEHSTTPPAKVQCDICGTWLKHERNLWHHLKTHENLQDAKALGCPICKKKVKSKRLLAIHIKRSHAEKKHQCTYCGKAFRIRKILQEHIAALHTGANLYTCPYCDRTFKSSANMYAHRKRAHFAEWTRDRTNNTKTDGIQLVRVESKAIE
ncbi:transcription factor grauzone-like isoform X3 [Bradysia coprophila]|uniref:transcription factor grauzone-like isoform X3 n=1 Tax=Bradysia coprophila TaxID=38358 RepID=UPI00187DA00D|nr:transcription factor grauzone-like isoform X3 [Bradysia coprophila]